MIGCFTNYNITASRVPTLIGLRNREQQIVIDSKFSYPSKVTSGVPQGSVSGPLLFQLFINDLPNGIESSVKLYADDVLIMRSITTPNDHQILQNDLIKLAIWSANWQMPFNLAKCEHLTVTNSPIHPHITIN